MYVLIDYTCRRIGASGNIQNLFIPSTYIRKTECDRMDATMCDPFSVHARSVRYPFDIRLISIQGPLNSHLISIFLTWSTVIERFFWCILYILARVAGVSQVNLLLINTENSLIF